MILNYYVIMNSYCCQHRLQFVIDEFVTERIIIKISRKETQELELLLSQVRNYSISISAFNLRHNK